MKHQQVPIVITVTQPTELLRASNLLRAHGFKVTYPPPGGEIASSMS